MATLTTAEILLEIIEAFKVRFPFYRVLTTDFSSESMDYLQQVIARVSLVPTVRDYDATTGYKANAAEANALSEDVPVTLNRHKHTPIKIDFLDQEGTKRNLYEEAIMNAAFALGKEAFDYILSQVLVANFSESSVYSVANSDKDMLDNIAGDMNTIGASPTGRYGLVNTGVYATLEADQRIASGDYHGQQRTDNAYGNLKNVAGFENIWEYPSLPANAQNLSGFFGTKPAIVMAARVPNKTQDLAASLGVPANAKFERVTDPDSGMTLLGITWVEQGTFDLYTTVAWMYGVALGSQGGAAGDKLDYAGHRLTII